MPRAKCLLILCVMIAATACSSTDPETTTVEVSVSVDVCAGDECFVAPVPGASVVVSAAGSEKEATTDDDGAAEIELSGSGTYAVRAEWQGLTAEDPSVSVSSGNDVEVTLRFTPAFRAS